jgi:hypothetical protein
LEPTVLRRRMFWVSSSIAALGGIVVACSSTTETVSSTPAADAAASDAVEEEDPVAVADAGGGTCTLPEDLSTGVKTCDDCLQKRCCTVIVTCFDDKACTTMNDCMNACRQKHGTTDAGADCTRGCAEKDNAAAEKLLDMLECQSSRCGTECKG